MNDNLNVSLETQTASRPKRKITRIPKDRLVPVTMQMLLEIQGDIYKGKRKSQKYYTTKYNHGTFPTEWMNELKTATIDVEYTHKFIERMRKYRQEYNKRYKAEKLRQTALENDIRKVTGTAQQLSIPFTEMPAIELGTIKEETEKAVARQEERKTRMSVADLNDVPDEVLVMATIKRGYTVSETRRSYAVQETDI